MWGRLEARLKKIIENGTTSLTDGDDISDRLYPSICRETAMPFPARELPFSYGNYGSGKAVSLWLAVREHLSFAFRNEN
ncbi:hypothetical protein QUB16_17890 [Microcoleus sp. D3_18a_C4]